jgi:hypothetical protein
MHSETVDFRFRITKLSVPILSAITRRQILEAEHQRQGPYQIAKGVFGFTPDRGKWPKKQQN